MTGPRHWGDRPLASRIDVLRRRLHELPGDTPAAVRTGLVRELRNLTGMSMTRYARGPLRRGR